VPKKRVKKGDASKKDHWFKLITNVTADQALLPDVSADLAVLRSVYDEVTGRGARMQVRKSEKQQETKDHRELMRKGDEAAGKIRAVLRGHLGFRSQGLVKYGIQPLPEGKRPPEEPVTESPEQPKPESPAPAAPEGQPAPQGTVPSKSGGLALQPKPQTS
jgi:hypothetical protein